MNKHKVIVVISSIIIAATISYGLWNVYALENLQIRWSNSEEFRYFEMSNDGKITVCNPLPFLAKVDQIEITPIYDGKKLGEFKTKPILLPPNNSTNIFGNFVSESFVESQYLFLHMDGELLGEQPIRVDPSKFFVQVHLKTNILGWIPIDIEKEYTGFDFMQMMRGQQINFLCSSN